MTFSVFPNSFSRVSIYKILIYKFYADQLITNGDKNATQTTIHALTRTYKNKMNPAAEAIVPIVALRKSLADIDKVRLIRSIGNRKGHL